MSLDPSWKKIQPPEGADGGTKMSKQIPELYMTGQQISEANWRVNVTWLKGTDKAGDPVYGNTEYIIERPQVDTLKMLVEANDGVVELEEASGAVAG